MTYLSFQAGLLTSGSSIFHTFPGVAPSGKTWNLFPVTAAGPSSNRTRFPF